MACQWCEAGNEPRFYTTSPDEIGVHGVRREFRPGEFYNIVVPCEEPSARGSARQPEGER